MSEHLVRSTRMNDVTSQATKTLTKELVPQFIRQCWIICTGYTQGSHSSLCYNDHHRVPQISTDESMSTTKGSDMCISMPCHNHPCYVTTLSMLLKTRHKVARCMLVNGINILKPAGHAMHQQFNIQQLYALPTLYLCVLYLSENKQRLVQLTA